jgi:hypothetical protein
MGIYGNVARSLIEQQNNDKVNILIIEMLVDKSFIDFINTEQEFLKEDIQADINLVKDKTEVTIMIRDKETVKVDKGCKHVNSCSFKVTGPDKLLKKAGGGSFDIIVPGFDESKSDEDLKPYLDKAVSGKFKKVNPPELQLALDFGEQERKLIKLIYDNPSSPNQKKLFKQLIKDCSEKYDISFKSTDSKLDENIRNSIE